MCLFVIHIQWITQNTTFFFPNLIRVCNLWKKTYFCLWRNLDMSFSKCELNHIQPSDSSLSFTTTDASSRWTTAVDAAERRWAWRPCRAKAGVIVYLIWLIISWKSQVFGIKHIQQWVQMISRHYISAESVCRLFVSSGKLPLLF